MSDGVLGMLSCFLRQPGTTFSSNNEDTVTLAFPERELLRTADNGAPVLAGDRRTRVEKIWFPVDLDNHKPNVQVVTAPGPLDCYTAQLQKVPNDPTRFIIPGSDLVPLTDSARKAVTYILWADDFKWFMDGYITHVHFGYDERYGCHARDITDITRNLLLEDCYYSQFPDTSNIYQRWKIKEIQVSLQSDTYTLVVPLSIHKCRRVLREGAGEGK